jgi:hypothetical protein
MVLDLHMHPMEIFPTFFNDFSHFFFKNVCPYLVTENINCLLYACDHEKAYEVNT